MKSYLWNILVFVNDTKLLTQTLEIPKSSTEIRAYAKRFQGDRFEAVTRPLECIGNCECQYDYLPFAAMKIRGELAQALVD